MGLRGKDSFNIEKDIMRFTPIYILSLHWGDRKGHLKSIWVALQKKVLHRRVK